MLENTIIEIDGRQYIKFGCLVGNWSRVIDVEKGVIVKQEFITVDGEKVQVDPRFPQNTLSDEERLDCLLEYFQENIKAKSVTLNASDWLFLLELIKKILRKEEE